MGNDGYPDRMDRTSLLCVHIDGELIYKNPNPWFDNYNCYIPEYIVNIDENKKEELKIYPTIVDNLLYVETDKNTENFEYKIINKQGQIINNGMIISNIIDISNLKNGNYFIIILDNKKYIKIQKFRLKIILRCYEKIVAITTTDNLQFKIYDLMGRVVSQLSNSQLTIDVSHLQAGVYFVKIGKQVQKFVKE